MGNKNVFSIYTIKVFMVCRIAKHKNIMSSGSFNSALGADLMSIKDIKYVNKTVCGSLYFNKRVVYEYMKWFRMIFFCILISAIVGIIPLKGSYNLSMMSLPIFMTVCEKPCTENIVLITDI